MDAFGDIVLARFPFTDLSGDKRRPALVISKHPTAGDVIVCFITSVPRSGPAIVPIGPEHGTGLKQLSFVRFDKIATLNTSLLTGRLGEASVIWLAAHAGAFCDVFGFRASITQGDPPNAL